MSSAKRKRILGELESKWLRRRLRSCNLAAQAYWLAHASFLAFIYTAFHQTPQEIIEHFVRVGDEWSNGRPQDDDVTFVVLKVIGNRTSEVNRSAATI